MLFTVDNGETGAIINGINYPSLIIINGGYSIEYEKHRLQTFIKLPMPRGYSIIPSAGRLAVMSSNNEATQYYGDQDRVRQWPLMQYDVAYMMIDASDELPITYITPPVMRIIAGFSADTTIINESQPRKYSYSIYNTLKRYDEQVTYAGPEPSLA